MADKSTPHESIDAFADVFTSPQGIKGLSEKLDGIGDEVLTPRQAILLEECRGILHAIANGHPVRERGVLRDNLIEACSLFSTEGQKVSELTKAQQAAVREMRFVLRVATAYGLAANDGTDRTRQLVGRRNSEKSP